MSVADAIGQDDEISRNVQRLAPAKKFARKFRPEELRAAPGGAVKNQNGDSDDALVVESRRAKRAIMHSKFGEGMPGIKLKIADGEIALRRSGNIRRVRD